jgi:hypothetical protein
MDATVTQLGGKSAGNGTFGFTGETVETPACRHCSGWLGVLKWRRL